MENMQNASSMPEYNKTNPGTFKSKTNISSRVFGGLLLIAIGLIFFAKKSGVDFPEWFLSWEMIVIGIGVYVGIRQSFRGPVWIVLTLIGGIFLIDDFYPEMDVDKYLLPLLFVAVGIIVIFRPQRKNNSTVWQTPAAGSSASGTDDEVIDAVTIFGGIKRNIFSKNFRGGEAVTIFGGTELNLSQADAAGPMVLELTQIFAGAKLIVPPHWKVQSDDMVCILGGVDDKRPLLQNAVTQPERILILKGTCIFGGIDIKSF